MNILLINYEYPPLGAGAATQNAYLARELAKNGHHVVQLTASYGKLDNFSIENGVQIYRVKSRREKLNQSNMLEMLSFVWLALCKLKYIVPKHKIEKAIVFFSIPCGPLGLWLKLRYKIPYVVSLRGGDVPGYDVNLNGFHLLLAPIRRMILRQAIAAVANSKGLAQLSYTADSIKTIVINNGVETEYFYPSTRKISNEHVQFLFVGRLHPIKNIRLLLDWAKVMCHSDEKFRLNIYGQGPEEDKINQYISENGLSGSIYLNAWLNKEELRQVYQQSDVFVNPSFNEGMPNTVMEAMACALSVIASDVAGNRDIIEHSQNGYLFKSDSLPAFVSISQQLMADAKLRALTGSTARISAVHHYSVKAMAMAYLELFASKNKPSDLPPEIQ